MSGSDPCLESSPWEQGAELGSRGAERDVQTEGRHRSGGSGLRLVREKQQKPPGLQGEAPIHWPGGQGGEDGEVRGQPRKRASGRHSGPAPRGGRGGPGGWKRTEAGFGSGQKSHLRFLTSGGKTRRARGRKTDRRRSQEDCKAPPGRFSGTGMEGWGWRGGAAREAQRWRAEAVLTPRRPFSFLTDPGRWLTSQSLSH